MTLINLDISELNDYLKRITKEVINNSNRLDNVNDVLAELESYLEIESMFESILDILESLKDIEHDAKTGRCNERGLNPEFLIEHLRNFESNKAGIAPKFASWEWQRYYSHELCTLALHNDELWLTMRIPIINLAEQLIRVIPLSNQLWIKEKSSSYGIDTLLFKFKQLEAYMITTRNDFETCSKLGSSRVCNIRNTKFR
jgi:hypothetical protein